MNKIPTLFKRNPEDMSSILPEVTPGCEWVLAGEGIATRKYDGTCVMFDGLSWWARREVKSGKETPFGYVAISTDEITGKTVGWEPIVESPFYKAFVEALDGLEWWSVFSDGSLEDASVVGTYELCGPKINGNPEKCEGYHVLIRHDTAEVLPLYNFSTTEWTAYHYFMDLMINELAGRGWEGLVWHHADGRMAKLKVRDFK